MPESRMSNNSMSKRPGSTSEAPIDRLLPLLSNTKSTGDHTYRACCPAHDDEHPSLDIKIGDDGTLLLQCRSRQCTAESICVAVGLTQADLFPTGWRQGNDSSKHNGQAARSKPKARKTYPTLDVVVKSRLQSPDLRGGKETRFRYTDTSWVIRFDFEDRSKSFRPVHRADDGWSVGDPSGKLPLYRITEVADHSTVYVCEGDGCVDTLWSIGLQATTSAHGSKSPGKSDWQPLADKNVVILPDSDEPGRRYAETVCESIRLLHALNDSTCTVKVLTLPDLPDGGDVVDFIKAHDSRTSEDLRDMIEAIAKDTPTWTPGPSTALRLTELGLAEHFVRAHAADFRYAKGWGWLAWDGKRFVRDDLSAVIVRLKDHVLGLYHEAAKTKNDNDRDAFLAFISRAERRSMMEAALWLGQSDPLVRIRAERLDRDPWLFNCLNGTINLTTGQLRKHRREDLLTKLSPVSYDPRAECPLFHQFLDDIMPSKPLQIFAQRSIGYALTGVIRQHVLNLLYGLGANGKSTWINAVMSIMGDYAMMAAPKLLMARKYDQHPTELADLCGKRFIASLETGEGHRLDEELVKRLTGGDRIKGRHMRQDFFEFEPSHKLFMATNHRPGIRGTDEGIWRRVRLWPFTVEIPKAQQDEKLGEKLLAVRAGILAWAVQGCLEWQANGLTEPDEVLAATASFREECDVLAGFISEHCIAESDAMVASCDLYAAFKGWAETSGEYVVSLTRFGKAIEERGFRKEAFGPTRRIHYFGLGLKG